MSTENFNDKFTIKYKAKTIEDLKLPNRIIDEINKESKVIYRFLFYGSAGLGKTSMASILSKNHDVLYLSGSNDFNINTLRSKIYPHANNYSVNNKEKIVIIDECERIKKQYQDAFKIILDATDKTCKFIFITNDITKLIEPFRSRCTEINFNFTGKEADEQLVNYVQYTVDICNKEDIKWDKPGLTELYKKCFPDFRKLLNTLQKFSNSKTPITAETVRNLTSVVSGKQILEIYDLVTKPTEFSQKDVYGVVAKYKDMEEDVFMSLCEPFFEYLNAQGKYEKTLDSAVIINKYCMEFNNTLNKFALMLSCINELRKLGI